MSNFRSSATRGGRNPATRRSTSAPESNMPRNDLAQKSASLLRARLPSSCCVEVVKIDGSSEPRIVLEFPMRGARWYLADHLSGQTPEDHAAEMHSRMHWALLRNGVEPGTLASSCEAIDPDALKAYQVRDALDGQIEDGSAGVSLEEPTGPRVHVLDYLTGRVVDRRLRNSGSVSVEAITRSVLDEIHMWRRV